MQHLSIETPNTHTNRAFGHKHGAPTGSYMMFFVGIGNSYVCFQDIAPQISLSSGLLRHQLCKLSDIFSAKNMLLFPLIHFDLIKLISLLFVLNIMFCILASIVFLWDTKCKHWFLFWAPILLAFCLWYHRW